MSNFFKKNKFNLIRFILLVPILMVAVISISHVVSWYDIANPFKWAVYLSISVEIAAMVSILAFSLRMKGGAWSIFLIVTFIQMIGNIFYSYKEIDQNGDLFKSWVELTGPIWEMIGSDTTDVPAMKRWLAYLEGGLDPGDP
jgi:ABC-type polysaccharide/polyol phosphate export permease